jgi:hypothetical protein
MNIYLERLIERAISRVQAGMPLSVDMTTRLLEAGIDVSELERCYAA